MEEATGLPRRLGDRYVLLRELGRGGMGSVFLAAAGGRLCAVKVLGGGGSAAPEDLARRFDEEARLAARLDHPGLAYVIESGAAAGERFIAMEYVRGKTLHETWARLAHLRRPFPLGLALHVCREVARALAYLHGLADMRLVHRDVTPQNVMLGYAGAVKLLDLGLAKDAGRAGETTAGVWGAAGYVSPERRRGEPFDGRADIYSLGVVMWELLARRPFPGEAKDGAGRLAPPDPPSRFVPALGVDLDALVLRCIAPRPEDRLASAADLADAVGRLLSGEHDARKLEATLREIFDPEIAAEQAEEAGLLARAAELPAAAPSAGSARPTADPAGSRERPPAASTGARGRKPFVPVVLGLVMAGALLAAGAVWVAANRRAPSAGTAPPPPAAGLPAPPPGMPPAVAGASGAVPPAGASRGAEPAPPAATIAAPDHGPHEARPSRATKASGRRGGPAASDPVDLIDLAESAFRRGSVNQALYHARAAVKAGGGLTAELVLGKVALGADRFDEAQAAYDAALGIAPGNQDARLGRRLVDERRMAATGGTRR